MATQGEMAAHLDMSQQSVSKLKNAGTISVARGGKGYDLDACRIAYIRHLRQIASGRDSTRPGTLEAERARLASAQAEAQERKNSVERRELVSLPDVSGAVIALISLAVTRLGQVGMHVAKGDHKLRVRIETAINDALKDLSATKVIEIGSADDTEKDEPDDETPE